MSLPPFLSTSPPPTTSQPSSARLKALYASTSSQKESNPTGYSANQSWWAGIIEECLRNGWIGEDRLVLRVDETLLERFENAERGRPKGLGGVIDGMAAAPAKIHPLASFMASPTPIYDPGSLAYRFVARPLLWTMGRLNPFGGGETVEKEEAIWKRVKGKEYVHLALLERAASNVVRYLDDNPAINYSDSLFSLTTFRETFGTLAIPSRSTASSSKASEKDLPAGEHKLSERDIEVLVKWLQRDMGVVCSDGVVVKLNMDGSEDSITEADRGTLTILNTISVVDKQVESLSAEISRCTTLAKDQLRASHRSLALATLRKKKSLEEVLEKRLATSSQLHKVLTSIDQAQNDVEVMGAYETATRTLKGVLANPKLDMDHVERTTEEMGEALASQEEVDQAIRVGGSVAVGAGGVGVDEDELEKELEGLVLDERERIAAEAKKREEAERVERGRREREEEERKVQERFAALQRVSDAETEKTKNTVLAAASTGPKQPDDQWRKTYDDAQQRQSEERQRAETERMRKEERRLAAE